MARTKKVEKIPENVVDVPLNKETSLVEKIVPFSGDFGRQDLDSLRDKVNEIIEFINK